MEASEFKSKVEKLYENLSNFDGPFASSGVGFFIGDIQELIEEWESEEHEYSM